MGPRLAAQRGDDSARPLDGLRPIVMEQISGVLILTSATGAGHDCVAVALQEAIHKQNPDVGVRVLDPLTGRSTKGSLSAGRWYGTMITHMPWLWGLLYTVTNTAWVARLGMAAGGLVWARRLRSAIASARPGIVVAVHPLAMRLAADVLRTVPVPPPLHCVVTDLVTVHQCWVSADVAAYYVATQDASDALHALGIPRERVQITGLPLRSSFANSSCGPVAGGPPRVLLLEGGYPSKRIEEIAHALLRSHQPLQLVIVCGRNARLRRHLDRTLGDRATVLGWRDDIAALMRWSSVVVTKGGPTTVAEALSQARPILISHALPGQEGGNVMLVTRSGAGRYVPDADALVHAVATCPRADAIGDLPQADWWCGAAEQVTVRLMAALAECTTPPRRQAKQTQGIVHDRIARMPAFMRFPAKAVAMWSDVSLSDDPAFRLMMEQAQTGHVIDNPISGERIIIRQTAAQTAGRLLSFDLFLPPGAHVPARHAHPHQEEQFTVVTGRMRFRLGHERPFFANPGDTVRVPRGTAHWFGNAGPCVSHIRVEVQPAMRMEEMFESAAAMARAGHFPGTRQPRLSDLAVFLSEFQSEVAVPDVPALFVRVSLAPFVWLARRRGRATLPGSQR